MHNRHPKLDCEECLPLKETLLHLKFGPILFQIDWLHWCFKALAFSALTGYLFFAWWLFSPWSPAWSSQNVLDPVVGHEALEKYFHTFSGNTECGIGLSDLYVPPQKEDNSKYARGAFCPNREKSLEAMTGGGRHGFDAPYYPKGCHYRWYSVPEICMILERFDSLVFIGDDTLRPIYSGLNMLLRQDLALGSLNPSSSSELNSSELTTTCRCDNQFIKDTCSKHALTVSDQVPLSNTQNQNPYLCSRTPHAFLAISGSPFNPSTLKSLRTLIPRAPPSNYHPIPIITSLTPQPGSGSAPSATLATQTLSSLLTFADSTARKTPILWLNPAATGHLDISGSKQRDGNNRNDHLWMFSEEMERVAREKDVEVLGLWNLTVQASSWDGRRFGSSVALVQAMMVVNWLSRLESS